MNDEAIAYSRRVEDFQIIYDFVTVFISITTVGTVLASAMSNRIDNTKIQQNYGIKDESEMIIEPDKSNIIILGAIV